MDKFIEVKNILSKYHHEYLLKYCDLVESKEKFLDEILNVDFDLQEKLYNSTKNSKKEKFNNVTTVNAIDKNSFSKEEFKEYRKIGEEEIKKGRLAIVTLAGRTRNKTWSYRS